jgi:hypothetical protein
MLTQYQTCVSFKSSVQVLYSEKDGQHVWWIWAGPYGLSVDPCNASPFELIFTTLAESYVPQGDDPLFPGLGPVTLRGNYPLKNGKQCLVRGHGQKSKPTLECGDSYMVFRHDVGFDSPSISCDNGIKYKRGWAVEY